MQPAGRLRKLSWLHWPWGVVGTLMAKQMLDPQAVPGNDSRDGVDGKPSAWLLERARGAWHGREGAQNAPPAALAPVHFGSRCCLAGASRPKGRAKTGAHSPRSLPQPAGVVGQAPDHQNIRCKVPCELPPRGGATAFCCPAGLPAWNEHAPLMPRPQARLPRTSTTTVLAPGERQAGSYRTRPAAATGHTRGLCGAPPAARTVASK